VDSGDRAGSAVLLLALKSEIAAWARQTASMRCFHSSNSTESGNTAGPCGDALFAAARAKLQVHAVIFLGMRKGVSGVRHS